MYFLLLFITVTLGKSAGEGISGLELNIRAVTEVFYLNKALALFNTGKRLASSIQATLLTFLF
jgi:hypothetical protein